MFRKLIVASALIAAALAGKDDDVCNHGGELRRNFECAAVRHTMKDACCWMKRDGSHGKLPYECCGTGWNTHGCEDIIRDACNTHPDDM